MMNQTEEAEAPRKYHEMRPIMESEIPAIFTPRKTPPVPLALGLGTALLEKMFPLFGDRDARRFLACWTMRPEYKWAILNGTTRHALDGTVVGEVTEAERAHALEGLCWYYAQRYASKKTKVEEIGNPAKKFRELAGHEVLRLKVIAKARELIEAKSGEKTKKHTEELTPA